MSENLAAKRLLALIPAIMQRWDDRVRDEVSPAAQASEIVLRDSLAQMLEVMAKVLGNRTDPRTAARDLAYLTIHGKERANQVTYSLEELILEFHILQEVVLEALEPDHLLIATRQARHMKQMLDDLLDLARINEGRIALQMTRVDLGTELQQALNVAQRLFALRKHVVSVSQAAERIYVMADPVRLGQCFSNLLTNAAKYTNLGGHIEVSLSRDDEGAVVQVRDNGVGIPADLLPNVFDLFRQAPHSPDRAGGGLGLGLTSCGV